MQIPYIVMLLLILTGMMLAAETSETDVNNADIYFENLLKGDYEACYQMSSPEVQASLSAQKLKETWESLVQQLGGYEGIIQTSKEAKESVTLYIYALNFSKMVLDMKISLDEKGLVTGLLFTPSSVSKPGTATELPPYLSTEKITVRKVDFDCQGLTVHGILTLPAKSSSYPLVLMLTGSGPNDMDETVGARKPFRDLADGLANQGVATLRWSKLTRDYPERYSNVKSFTVRDEYLPELIAALNWVDANDSIKADSYFVLGHSMGAFILPMAAKEFKDIAGYIMLAGNARPLEDLIVEQYTYILGREGMDQQRQVLLKKIKSQAEVVKHLSANTSAPDTLLLNVPKAYWLSMNDYNQVKTLKATTAPFLILQGEKDYQVSMKDYNIWKAAIKKRKNSESKSYPNLDHLFMYSEGDSTPDSYLTPAFVSKEVIDDIAGWVKSISNK